MVYSDHIHSSSYTTIKKNLTYTSERIATHQIRRILLKTSFNFHPQTNISQATHTTNDYTKPVTQPATQKANHRHKTPAGHQTQPLPSIITRATWLPANKSSCHPPFPETRHRQTRSHSYPCSETSFPTHNIPRHTDNNTRRGRRRWGGIRGKSEQGRGRGQEEKEEDDGEVEEAE